MIQEKIAIQMFRLHTVFKYGERASIPFIKVEEEGKISVVDVLAQVGKSKSEARRLIKQNAIKVEDSYGVKHTAKDLIDDSMFTPFKDKAGTFLWVGNQPVALIYC